MSGKAEERVFDVRVLERNIRKGLLTRKDLEKYLKSLPDSAENAESFHLVSEGNGASGSSGSNGQSNG